jgi:lysophospholipase L1-like esterase
MTPASRSRPRRSRAGFFLLFLLVALLSWEIAGRVTGSAGPTPWKFLRASWAVAGGQSAVEKPAEEDVARMKYRALPYVMFALKPSWDKQSSDGLFRTTNSLGFRGREVELPKPAGRYRIVCLGGSTTFSDAVGDEDAYPLQMETMLREARPDLDLEVVNAGMPSYTSAESLANLAFRCLDLEPDAIVVYQGVNDYRVRVYGNFDSAYFHWRKVWNGTADDWETGEGEMAGGINQYIQHMPPEPKGDQEKNVARAGTGTYRRNLTSIAGIAAAHGVRTVFVSTTVDEKGTWTPELMVSSIKEHNRVMRDVAAEQSALFIDLDPQFPQAGNFHDPVHLNAQGTALKARLIADGLLESLW